MAKYMFLVSVETEDSLGLNGAAIADELQSTLEFGEEYGILHSAVMVVCPEDLMSDLPTRSQR